MSVGLLLTISGAILFYFTICVWSETL